MILYYFIFGALMSVAGALPIGTVNLAVIHTSLYENTRKALHIIVAAGIGEVFLATMVLIGSIEISVFLEKNTWIHILIISMFLCTGLYLLLYRKTSKSRNKLIATKKTYSKYITGFLLAILNPPVLIYWTASIAVANMYFLKLNTNIPTPLLVLFFIGVYIGKILTLYFYSLWGNRIAQKHNTPNQKSTKIIGFIFILLSIFQGIKLWIR